MAIDLGPTVGSIFLGSLFASLLYGASCAQLLYYLRHYPSDRLPLKALVLGLWLLETLLSCTDVYMSWLFLVKDHGDYAVLAEVPNAWIVENTAASLLVAIVQTFYIHSVWQLQAESLFRVPVMVISALVLTTLAANLATTVISSSKSGGDAVGASEIPGLIKNISAILADVCICSALISTLRKRRTGVHRTDGIIQTLMVYIINRALLTLMMQVVLLAVFIISAMRNAMFWAIFNSPTSRIYYTSMMAVLNARSHITAKITSGMSSSVWIDDTPQRDPLDQATRC
ncbi:hypothetical protein FOMPIDRAFT_1045023 [Fomitopsis schrenkii]|uniref:DUF6534 domain-containing protein n=1 Tax=Fomitopsis schrenkii TaxID=2126942 RepID=S8EKU7_FOMSC|nr:hypothetical protein FOMPIDRAFT_1045023 [Fomitopsis schrenkii]